MRFSTHKNLLSRFLTWTFPFRKYTRQRDQAWLVDQKKLGTGKRFSWKQCTLFVTIRIIVSLFWVRCTRSYLQYDNIGLLTANSMSKTHSFHIQIKYWTDVQCQLICGGEFKLNGQNYLNNCQRNHKFKWLRTTVLEKVNFESRAWWISAHVSTISDQFFLQLAQL